MGARDKRLVLKHLKNRRTALSQILGIAPALEPEQDYPPVQQVDGMLCKLDRVRETYVMYVESV